jgi:hypothetical protein
MPLTPPHNPYQRPLRQRPLRQRPEPVEGEPVEGEPVEGEPVEGLHRRPLRQRPEPVEGEPAERLRRVVDLETGTAMVVTDLHGAWDDYRRYRDRFLALQANGQADYLIFTGDLIHSEGPPETDHSLDILLDLLALRQDLGARLIYLMGNHELPHLYGVTLAKGQNVYTPRFEAALGAHREAIYALLDQLPFYVRTRAGVSVCHAGAAAEMSAPGAAPRVFTYSHRRVREALEALLPADQRPAIRQRYAQLVGDPYDDLARFHLAVSGPEDPRYDDLLIGFLASSHPDFDLLWAALFTRNEQQYGERDYAVFLDVLLQELSVGYHRQELLVTGHVPCRGGHNLVAGRQLRLASGAHAHPHRSGRYLLFDVAQPLRQARELSRGLGSVFD